MLETIQMKIPNVNIKPVVSTGLISEPIVTSKTKLFDEVISTPSLKNLTSLGEGNIVLSSGENQYMLSTFKQALLKFKKQDSLDIREEWFSDVELFTQDQFEAILKKLEEDQL